MAEALAHQERGHSSIGASSAHRWMLCPASVRACEGMRDLGNIYADTGTAAHQLAQKCLVDPHPEPWDFKGDFETVGNHQIEITPEMCEAVQTYVDYVRGLVAEDPSAVLFVEHEFDLSSLHEGMFGTNDAMVYIPSTRVLHVIDYKNGVRPVSAEENLQLLYYAIGAIRSQPELKISTVRLTIVQPNAGKDPFNHWDTTPFDLLCFEDRLLEAVLATEDPNAPFVPGEEQCHYCLKFPTCKAAESKALGDASDAFGVVDNADLSGEEIADRLNKASYIEDWIKALWAHAMMRLEMGEPVPGYKLVAKRATRKWNAPDFDIVAALSGVIPLQENELFERSLKSPAQLEKKIPKAQRHLLDDFVVKESSGNTMAREDDKRAEVAPSINAFDEIKEE